MSADRICPSGEARRSPHVRIHSFTYDAEESIDGDHDWSSQDLVDTLSAWPVSLAPHDFFGQPSARRRMSYVQGKTARG